MTNIKMTKSSCTILLCFTSWVNKNDKLIYNFLPNRLESNQFDSLLISENLDYSKYSKNNYKLYEENESCYLEFLDNKYKILLIDKSVDPNLLVLQSPSNQEILFESSSLHFLKLF
jgi:hypothetical protein